MISLHYYSLEGLFFIFGQNPKKHSTRRNWPREPVQIFFIWSKLIFCDHKSTKKIWGIGIGFFPTYFPIKISTNILTCTSYIDPNINPNKDPNIHRSKRIFHHRSQDKSHSQPIVQRIYIYASIDCSIDANIAAATYFLY